MIRTFISVMPNGDVRRHETAPTELIRAGAVAIIEIAPKMAQAEVKVFVIDEGGEQMEEVL